MKSYSILMITVEGSVKIATSTDRIKLEKVFKQLDKISMMMYIFQEDLK